MSDKFGTVGEAVPVAEPAMATVGTMIAAGRRRAVEREAKLIESIIGPLDGAPVGECGDGIRCPRCKATVWTVYTTRHESNRIVRVRTCSVCRLRVRTREVIEATVGESPAPAAVPVPLQPDPVH